MWLFYRLFGFFFRWKWKRDFGYDSLWDYDQCPHCAYGFDWGDALGKDTRNWTYFNGDVTVYAFEGTVTCPRCKYKWEYSDES